MAVAYSQLVASLQLGQQGLPFDPNLQLMQFLPFYTNNNILTHSINSASTSATPTLAQSLHIPKTEPVSCESNGSSPSGSPDLSRTSYSPESGASRVKRGRPQQEIHDEDDPTSQKRKHRRLYARQYRAQMRQQVDQVKVLRNETEELRRMLRENEAELKRVREELLQKNFVISSLMQSRVSF